MSRSTESWMSVEDVAAEMKVPVKTVRELIAQGQLASVSAAGEERIPAAALERLVQRSASQATRRRWFGRPLLVAAAVGLAAIAIAATTSSIDSAPRQIPYRGYLELDGVPVSNTVDFVFELFTVASGGTSVWSENQSGISVLNGNFNVALGAVTSIPTELLRVPALYLAITVDSKPLAGRQRLLTVPYARYSPGSPPVGTVVAFGGVSIEADNWKICNGAALRKADYPALYAAIRGTYGEATDTFNLPDLRGRFARGMDLGSNRDLAARTADKFQDWATRAPQGGFNISADNWDHGHPFKETVYRGTNTYCGGGEYVPGNTFFANWGWSTSVYDCLGWRVTDSVNHAHSHSVTAGDSETRPANVAVNWIIKVAE